MVKRKNVEPIDNTSLLQLIKKPDIVKVSYQFTNHNDWEALTFTNDAYEVFKTWYNDNHTDYKHIKHAFNSLCKHYDMIKLTRYNIEKKFIIWKFVSFQNEHDSDGKTWIYHLNDCNTKYYKAYCSYTFRTKLIRTNH